MSAALRAPACSVAVLEERGHGSSAVWHSSATAGLQSYTEQLHMVKNVPGTSAPSYSEVIDRMKNLNERNLLCQGLISCLVTSSWTELSPGLVGGWGLHLEAVWDSWQFHCASRTSMAAKDVVWQK